VGATGHVTGLDLNAGMLAVARALPPPSGASITWIEGSAIAMNLPDASFDVIICQQGFQFFPDQPAALREMHRVLVPGGRVLLSVWKSAGPYNIAVGEALGRHVDPETATRYRASRVVPGTDYLGIYQFGQLVFSTDSPYEIKGDTLVFDKLLLKGKPDYEKTFVYAGAEIKITHIGAYIGLLVSGGSVEGPVLEGVRCQVVRR
jgi:SAM-dependent methyltransferase